MAAAYQGELTTETMLMDGINEGVETIIEISEYLAQLNPDKVYLAVPIRPTAETDVRAPTEEKINRAFQIVKKRYRRLNT